MDETYIESCDNCGANIVRDSETDAQLGRCTGCGWHENDEQCHANPFVPLDFNED